MCDLKFVLLAVFCELRSRALHRLGGGWESFALVDVFQTVPVFGMSSEETSHNHEQRERVASFR